MRYFIFISFCHVFKKQHCHQLLSHIDFGIQINGNEVSTQVNEIDLAGNHAEVQNDFELI